jgi:NDP-mannose synthase
MTEGVYRINEALTTRARRAGRRRPPQVVVLAGGRGTRLAPYTSVLPKPLMPIGDRSILELVLEQLRACGITNVTLCVGYLSHLISAVLDSGSDRGLDIRYVREEFALGTAAPLRLVPDLDDTFIVMNGDVLTTLDFTDLVRYHRRAGNMLTIATHQRTIKIDYGVLRLGTNGRSRRVEGYDEKPELKSNVSMGIYVVEPAALEHIPDQGHLDFPDLVRGLLRSGARVGSYAYDGLWFDIGRRTDYEQAVAAWFEQQPEEEETVTVEPRA